MSAIKKVQQELDKISVSWNGQTYEFEVLAGSEGELAFNIESLRTKTGLVTLDRGYGNTASCLSKITFLDGENGVLRYRGYDIADLADRFDFDSVCYLLLEGDLPDTKQLANFKACLKPYFKISTDIQKLLKNMPIAMHPMAMLSAAAQYLTAAYPKLVQVDASPEARREMIYASLASLTSIAAMIYRVKNHKELVSVKNCSSLTEFFYQQMFGTVPSASALSALNKLFILHADHEQNCSTSTVRLVGSSKAPLFASISAGISALWGPLHGGANQAVLEMLQEIHDSGQDLDVVLKRAKDKDDTFKLMGFGHRVYKNFDPRAKIIKEACDGILAEMDRHDPLLDVAKQLEQAALKDPYFVERKLYPNVDFYSGIIYRALGIPVEMFTVMFAVGRMPGWLSHWQEMITGSDMRIGRPRQIYQGKNLRKLK